VDVKNIDKGKWESCYEDDYLQGFELKVWCVSLKRILKYYGLKVHRLSQD
jgi:hypothetical protein